MRNVAKVVVDETVIEGRPSRTWCTAPKTTRSVDEPRRGSGTNH